MSSVVSALDSLPKMVSYFRTTAALSTRGMAATVDSGKSVSSVMTLADFDLATSPDTSSIGSGVILRDMGKPVTINDGGLNTLVYRRVQIVSGAATEGVDPTGAFVDFYVLVWSAAGTNVSVVRTG